MNSFCFLAVILLPQFIIVLLRENMMLNDGTLWAGIGAISLNIAFVLYLIVYIPQIIHNKKTANIAQLSLGLHFLLFLSYLSDLFYGFADQLPWQYKTVSIVGLTLVTLQHIQLIQFFAGKKVIRNVILGIVFLVVTVLVMYYFFIVQHATLTDTSTLVMGLMARGLGLIYCFPQLIKNKITKSGNAISLNFIYLNLTLALLDTISSWCLNWGWPNKLASPINAGVMLVLRYQVKRYDIQPFSLTLNRPGEGINKYRKATSFDCSI